MLALFLLLTFFQAITLNDLTLLSTLFIYFWSPSQTKVREWSCQRSRYYHVIPQLAFCCLAVWYFITGLLSHVDWFSTVL